MARLIEILIIYLESLIINWIWEGALAYLKSTWITEDEDEDNE